MALDDGGVIFASDDSTTFLRGGDFVDNEASHGGVAIVGRTGTLRVLGGNVSGNSAHNEGGAFSVDAGGHINVGQGLLPVRLYCWCIVALVSMWSLNSRCCQRILCVLDYAR